MNPTSASDRGKSGGSLPVSLPADGESLILVVKSPKVLLPFGLEPDLSGEDEPRSGGRYGYFCNMFCYQAIAMTASVY